MGQTFNEKYTTWLKKYAGFRPKDVDQWVRDIQESHVELSDILGGDKFSRQISLEEYNDIDGMKKDNYIPQYIDVILTYLPGYLSKYGIKKDDMFLDYIQGVKIGKHILEYIKRGGEIKLQNQYENQSYVTQRIKDYLNQMAMYKANYGGGGEFNAMISMTPQAFACVGHYDCDEGCFAQCAGNQSNKYNFAISKNTFVVLVSQKGIEIDDEFNVKPKTIVCRALGWLHKDCVAIHNVYTYKTTMGTMKNVIGNLVKEAFGKNFELIEHNISISPRKSFWHNIRTTGEELHKKQDWVFGIKKPASKQLSLKVENVIGM